MTKPICFVFFGLYFGSFLLFILAFSTPWWYKRGNESRGLFKECYRPSYGVEWICTYKDFSKTPGAEIGAMALMVLALFAEVIAFFMSILAIAIKFNLTVSAIVCGVGGFLQFIAVCIYGASFEGETNKIGWSFGLDCVCMAVQLITTVVVILVDRLSKK